MHHLDRPIKAIWQTNLGLENGQPPVTVEEESGRERRNNWKGVISYRIVNGSQGRENGLVKFAPSPEHSERSAPEKNRPLYQSAENGFLLPLKISRIALSVLSSSSTFSTRVSAFFDASALVRHHGPFASHHVLRHCYAQGKSRIPQIGRCCT